MDRKQTVLYTLLFSVLALVVYAKLFSANFISWDDGEVVLNNKDVHRFDLKAFFSGYYVGNYAPITMISFAIDWLIFKGNAAGHHAMSLLFHIANSILAYKFAELILKDKLKALCCAVIFCFHPLQVETVAWISAKNNLVYSLFFLSGLISYVRFISENNRKFYWYTLICFVLAVLSKPSAISFPLILILLDYLLKAKPDYRSLLRDKLPFVIIAVVFGIVTIYTRTEDKFMNQNHAYAIHERIGYAGYAILQYFGKFLLPINLSVIYPYPANKFLSLFLGYIVIILLVLACFKLYKASGKVALFGLLFFIVNLILVLQFIPFGEVLTADRYMYLPILGLAFSLSPLFSYVKTQLKIIPLILVLILGILTFNRASVWKNSVALYSDILKKYPHSYAALNSLGAEYMLNKNYDLAASYLNQSIKENPANYKGYFNRGLLYAQTDQTEKALNDFNKAIELKQYLKAYAARANIYYELKDLRRAMQDAEHVLRTEPNNIKANYVLANCYSDMDQLGQALSYYNKCITLNENEPAFYFKRAIVFGKQQKFSECLKDLDTSTTLDPKFAEAYYWKGVAEVNLKKDPCPDFLKAANLGFRPAEGPYQKYCH